MNKVFLPASDELIEHMASVIGRNTTHVTTSLTGFKEVINDEYITLLKPDGQNFLEGIFVEVSDEELWCIDQWKDILASERIFVNLSDEVNLVSIYTTNQPSWEEDNLKWMDRNRIISDRVCQYKKNSFNNKIPYSDIYLMVPVTMNQLHSYVVCEPTIMAAKIISELENNYRVEFSDPHISSLEHKYLGIRELEVTVNSDSVRQKSMVFLSLHEGSNIGVLFFAVTATEVSTHHLLNYFCEKKTRIVEREKSLELVDWIVSIGADICGSHRSVVFSSGALIDAEISKALVCEASPMGDIIGHSFLPTNENNLAQYSTAKVFASEVCLIEVSDGCNTDLLERLESQCVELFFIQMILLQDCAVSRISKKIRKELDKEVKDPLRKNKKEVLDELTSELSQSMMFFDYRKLVYPTVRHSAELIANKFGMAQIQEAHIQHKEVLERMFEIHHVRVEEIENNLLNILLLLLAVVQLLPMFKSMIDLIQEGSFILNDLYSWVGSISACFVIWIIYKMTKRRVIRTNIRKKR